MIHMRMRRSRPGTPFAVVLAGVPIPPHLLSPPRFSPDSPFFRSSKTALYSRSFQTAHSRRSLFQKYQLITPTLLLAILISLLVLFPIIWFGVLALTSVEIPLKMGDIVKSDKHT
jgi:hypothetical protein